MLTYSTDEVARASGLSYRQLDRWARLGDFTPSLRVSTGSGKSRRWSQADVLAAVAVGRIAPLWGGQVPRELVRRAVAEVRAGRRRFTVRLGPASVTFDIETAA